MRTVGPLIVIVVLTQVMLTPLLRPIEVAGSLDKIYDIYIIAYEMDLILGEKGKFPQHGTR